VFVSRAKVPAAVIFTNDVDAKASPARDVRLVLDAWYAVDAVNAADPSVPPAPMFKVEASVPASVRVFDTVSVLEVVPPAIVNPVAAAVNVSPFTVLGVIAPSVRVIAGVVPAVATDPEIPFAVVTDTVVTVPVLVVYPEGLEDK